MLGCVFGLLYGVHLVLEWKNSRSKKPFCWIPFVGAYWDKAPAPTGTPPAPPIVLPLSKVARLVVAHKGLVGMLLFIVLGVAIIQYKAEIPFVKNYFGDSHASSGKLAPKVAGAPASSPSVAIDCSGCTVEKISPDMLTSKKLADGQWQFFGHKCVGASHCDPACQVGNCTSPSDDVEPGPCNACGPGN